ncbi:MAG: hypothetical protein CL596_10820 [Alteromonas sp.]|nr:hypothetical protein [Alteromonas sp.]
MIQCAFKKVLGAVKNFEAPTPKLKKASLRIHLGIPHRAFNEIHKKVILTSIIGQFFEWLAY